MAHSHGQKTANGSTRGARLAAGERDWRRGWAGGEANLVSNEPATNLKPHLDLYLNDVLTS